MIFAYDKYSKQISLYDETDFKSLDLLERQDIEKWVENYPDLLGEELLILTTEYDKFDKTSERLDLLAIDKFGNLVIIELKRDDSGKYVDLQAIKYAAYCSTLTFEEACQIHLGYLRYKKEKIDIDTVRQNIINFIGDNEFEELSDTPRIILVSRDFRPEVTASVLWLRKFGLDIKCVRLTPYQMDKNKIIFSSNILIPLPEAEDYLIKAEKKDIKERTLSITQQEYLKFYNDLSNRISNVLPGVQPKISTRSYCPIPTGIPGIHFEWGFHGRPRSSFAVELHFEKNDIDTNQSMCKAMEKLKTTIEKETCETAVFEKDWTKRWSRIYIEKNEGKITEKLENWAVDNMIIFYKIFMPELKKYR